jgi:cytochrome c biogenesis protein ResB
LKQAYKLGIEIE